MAAIPTSELSEQHKQELVCTYAALILADEKMDITAESIQKLVAASGNTVEPYMPMLFARALHGQDVAQMLRHAGGPPAAAPAAGAAAPAAGAPAASGAPSKKEEKKEEPEEEEDDMGFSLFD